MHQNPPMTEGHLMDLVVEGILPSYQDSTLRRVEGFTEGRLVVSEKNLHTTDDIVGRSIALAHDFISIVGGNIGETFHDAFTTFTPS